MNDNLSPSGDPNLQDQRNKSQAVSDQPGYVLQTGEKLKAKRIETVIGHAPAPEPAPPTQGSGPTGRVTTGKLK